MGAYQITLKLKKFRTKSTYYHIELPKIRKSGAA